MNGFATFDRDILSKIAKILPKIKLGIFSLKIAMIFPETN